MRREQLSFLPDATSLPEGLVYRAEFLTRAEEEHLVARFSDLPFKPFEC